MRHPGVLGLPPVSCRELPGDEAKDSRSVNNSQGLMP
jgi:hypothetical protein